MQGSKSAPTKELEQEHKGALFCSYQDIGAEHKGVLFCSYQGIGVRAQGSYSVHAKALEL
ncbi:MAG: hypothetical protein K0S01_2736 [Herbinix sp.]|jgi:hypothetical protein|nr:hypothetical protein [Herbinix sp.]